MYSFRRINFKRASSASVSKRDCDQCGSFTSKEDIDESEKGREVQSFYERLIATPSCENQSSDSSKQHEPSEKEAHKKAIKRKFNKPQTCEELQKQKHLILKLAQEGNLKMLKRTLRNGNVALDFTDKFMWTPLMCAACAGHEKVVIFLLKNGARVNGHFDSSGRSAIDLARLNNHVTIASLLESHSKGELQLAKKKFNNDLKEPYWCAVCQQTFEETKRSEHDSSTIHIFNCQYKPQGSMYYISEGNKGFQMLLKEGWDKEKGLGPDGREGQKFPVKTILKRDRQGLGAQIGPSARPKVTHFKPFDTAAVKRPKVDNIVTPSLRQQTVDKRARNARELKTREWERDFRQSFNLE